MVEWGTVRTALGIIGNVTSFGLFLSPVPTFIQIWRWRSTRQFSGVVYVITLLNCLLWVFYGIPLVHPHSTLIYSINSIGAFLEICYVSLFLFFASRKARLQTLALLSLSLCFFAVVVLLSLLLNHSHDSRSRVVGIICVIVGSCMYASPLTIMRRVIATRCAKYLPPSICFANFINGLIWTGYALIHFDIFVTIPNAAGAFLGACQLLLYAVYRNGKDPDDDVDQSAIEDGFPPKESELVNIDASSGKALPDPYISILQDAVHETRRSCPS